MEILVRTPMKSASSTLITNLTNNSQFYRADLWTIVLPNGQGTLRYTSWPNTLTTTDARVFVPGTPNFVRNQLSSAVGVKVTTLNVEIHAQDSDLWNNVPVIQYI